MLPVSGLIARRDETRSRRASENVGGDLGSDKLFLPSGFKY